MPSLQDAKSETLAEMTAPPVNSSEISSRSLILNAQNKQEPN